MQGCVFHCKSEYLDAKLTDQLTMTTAHRSVNHGNSFAQSKGLGGNLKANINLKVKEIEVWWYCIYSQTAMVTARCFYAAR